MPVPSFAYTTRFVEAALPVISIWLVHAMWGAVVVFVVMLLALLGVSLLLLICRKTCMV